MILQGPLAEVIWGSGDLASASKPGQRFIGAAETERGLIGQDDWMSQWPSLAPSGAGFLFPIELGSVT